MKRVGVAALAAYIATIVLANWLVQRYGIVPVGFSYTAPCAVYLVGVAFTLRDVVQRTLGPVCTLAAIVIGAALSWQVASGKLAVASGVAFLVSETADLAVYTPLRRRGWWPAVLASNVVGLVVDSVLFLALAFGSQQYLPGQIIGKAWMTAAALLVLAMVPRREVIA